MNRGLKNIYAAGQVMEIDEKKEMSVWGKGTCNQILGSDVLLFSPLQKKENPLSIYIRQACAALHLKYDRRASYRGIDLHVFVNEFDIAATNNLSCFCRQPDKCPIRGTMDLFPCVKLPITISMPHFYDSDPSLLANIASGLEPNKEKHELCISLELVNEIKIIVHIGLESVSCCFCCQNAYFLRRIPEWL